MTMADRNTIHTEHVFDWTKKEWEPEAKKKEEEVRNYEVLESEAEVADKEHPILILETDGEELPHHIKGTFADPKRKDTFRYVSDGQTEYADFKSVDKRFIRLLSWLSENQLVIRLSGVNTDRGYCVLKMHATDQSGRTNAVTAMDSFLQLCISRLQAGKVPEDIDMDDDEEEEMRITSLSDMIDFIDCAGTTLPKNIRKWALRNLEITRSATVSLDEKHHAQRALSMMLNVQWKGSYFESIDPVEARKILDEELFGMEHVKQRIIETIIQINRTHTLPAYGILLAGPAGVGKSQVAYAVARILKLPWTSLDMSTIHDPEALTGSPRVYANAKPGRIMEAFTRAGASNLVFIINELDKADASGANGNPADALLTLLDNLGYTDNYIECMIPTGGVYPIATANDKSRISDPLLTRFAVIDIPDYTPEEKKVIFKRYSLPRILARIGMKEGELTVTDDAIDIVIRHTAGSTGVRDLEQAAEHLAANALYRIETQGLETVRIDAKMAEEILEY